MKLIERPASTTKDATFMQHHKHPEAPVVHMDDVIAKVDAEGKKVLIAKILPGAFQDGLDQFFYMPGAEQRDFILSKGSSFKQNLMNKAQKVLSNDFTEAELKNIAKSFTLTQEERILQREVNSKFQIKVINDIFVGGICDALYL